MFRTCCSDRDVYKRQGVGSVDISKYKKLVTYRCAGNNLTKLDVTKNKKLRTLDCQKNRLKYLDLRKSTNLTNIELNDNELTSFDISNISGLGWYKFDNQYYTIAKGKKIDLAKLPGFDMSKIGKVTGGTRSDGGYGIIPVSYTHLDVYKRQISSKSSC